MNTEILGIIFMYILTMLLAIPLGRYMGKVFSSEKTLLDNIFNPLDKVFYRLGGINPTYEMNWKEHLIALLTINAIWFLISMFVLTNMSWLPLNPDGNPSMSADLAFNTSVSFVTNTNLQHYSGESGLSYLGQLILMLWQFISGLMVGRTPEFLGKKIEAKEMKIAMIVALLHPLLILLGTAIATYLHSSHPDVYASWLANPSYHGFSEMLYEFTSSSANNGSGFEGLGDNTPFWNIACGIVMLIARYIPIIAPVAIAGILAEKKYIPESAGTLKTDTNIFAIMVFAIIAIIAALSFFPVLALGPIAEYFSLY